MSVHPLVVGTAGHIDHGKTALVHALTGIDTDRLAVEKERGITTELGFAHLDLGGRRIAVVDVPGHERFLRSMVAGAGEIDLVLFVIACDEGVMPQTREHLAVCQLLGVRRGIVVLTKRDLVDDDWLALVRDDVRAALAGSFLADAAMIPVSVRSGTGLDELRRALTTALDDLPPRDDTGLLRLPLDRIFTIRGFGTVVTGTIASGRLALGDDLVILPRGLPTRARGVELHGTAADGARAGMRCAVNVAGLATGDLLRGDVLAHPGAIVPSHVLDVRFQLLATARRALRRRSKILVHHGTTQVLATLALVERDTLEPGETAFAQLRVDAATPLVALPGDRFLARGFLVQRDHGTTLGGGVVVRVLAPRLRRSDDPTEILRRLADARLAERVALDVRAAGPAGLTAQALAHRTGQPEGALVPVLAERVTAGDLVLVPSLGGDAIYLHAVTLAELERRALDHLGGHLGGHVIGDGVPREELRARLPAALPPRAYDDLIAGLAARGLVEIDADRLRRPRPRAPAPSPVEADLVDRFARWGLEPPRPREVAAATGHAEPAVRTALDRLLASGAILKIKPDLYVDAAAVAALRVRLVAHLDAHGQITPGEWKDVAGTSRKYSIPLAEHFDAEKLTLRVGDIRRRR